MVLPLNYLLIMKTIRKSLCLLFLPVISGILLYISVPGFRVLFISFLALIPLLFTAQKTLSFKKYFSVFSLQLPVALVVFFITNIANTQRTVMFTVNNVIDDDNRCSEDNSTDNFAIIEILPIPGVGEFERVGSLKKWSNFKKLLRMCSLA